MSDTIFSKIINNEIPADIVFENEEVLGFKDISPQAKDHFIFIHKKATKDISHLTQSEPHQLLSLFKAIEEFSQNKTSLENGYRLVTNKGKNAGQTVFHTHIHLLGGEPLGSFGK